MEDSSQRKPFAVANWKMAMTAPEGLAFVREFRPALGSLTESMNVVLCPPYTALYPLSEVLADSSIDLGAQDVSAGPGESHTGAISPQLLASIGCKWVMLGHLEVRRRTGETDADCNAKMHACFGAGLRPILLIGEGAAERGRAEEALAARLPDLFAGCDAEQVARSVVIYEPEWTIGAPKPASPADVAAGCSIIRRGITRIQGVDAANRIRIIYGGSVAPEYAEDLLASPDVDGLGGGRKSRDPSAFAQIVRLIAAAKGL
jgi:triosephosphate isomerase